MYWVPWGITAVPLHLLGSLIVTHLAVCPFPTCISAADILSTNIIFITLSMSMCQWTPTLRHSDKAVTCKQHLLPWLVSLDAIRHEGSCTLPQLLNCMAGNSALEDSINKYSRCHIFLLYYKQTRSSENAMAYLAFLRTSPFILACRCGSRNVILQPVSEKNLCP